jgi:hypothetical protein
LLIHQKGVRLVALQASQTLTTAAAAPVAITPAASDTIAESSFGPAGVNIRVITTGTATDVAVLDPGFSPISNPGTVTPQTMPATGVRQWLIPRGAINPTTNVATVTFSGARTGVTYELTRA